MKETEEISMYVCTVLLVAEPEMGATPLPARPLPDPTRCE